MTEPDTTSRAKEATERLVVPVSDILLDPNSFRLAEDPLWEPVPDENIGDEEVQRHLLDRLIHYYVVELPESISKQGWLDIEPLWTRRLESDGKLVIVDGNRRLAALRSLDSARRQLALFASEDARLPLELTVHVLAEPDTRLHSLALGARHQWEHRPWSRLGLTLWRERHHEQYDEWPLLIRRFRRSARLDVDLQALDLARRLRHLAPGLHPSASYDFLHEALSMRTIARWLGLTENSEPETVNIDRFLSWLIPQGDLLRSDTDERESDTDGPLISDTRDLYKLTRVLLNSELRARLDDGAPLEELFALDTRSVVAIDEPEAHLHPAVIARLTAREPIDSARAQHAIDQLREALLRKNEQPVEPGTTHPWPLAVPDGATFLKAVELTHFRGLSGVSLSDLGRINVLVGVNNAGKTSVLEAIYTLSRLSDPRGLLDTLRVRTRQDPERSPIWLSHLLDGLKVALSATTNQGEVSVRLQRGAAKAGVDMATYIPGLRLEATVGTVRHTTDTELFSNRPRRTIQTEGDSVWLAPAVLHSPFARLDRSTLIHWYEASIKQGVLEQLLSLVRAAIDPGVKDIRLVSETGQFVVQHDERPALDLINYGEGLQRVFEIGLLFAAHRGGLVLVDELETAVHTNALLGLTRMIQELAVRFDVQVFLTTHSKETVDAFLLNGYRTNDVVAFLLRRLEHGEIGVQRFAGPALKRAVEVGDVDLRRL